MAALPEREPSDSTMQAIVEAVPWSCNGPERLMQLSVHELLLRHLAGFDASLNCQTTVPEPIASPR